MKINVAHIREKSSSGGWIDYAVFGAKSNLGSRFDNQSLLERLTLRARGTGLKIDQAALAFKQNGRVQYFGSRNLVQHLSRAGHPGWTHTIDA